MQRVPEGLTAMCVNPGNLAHPDERATIQAYFPRHRELEGQDGITTPFVFYRDLYSARCVDGVKGRRVLEVAENDEPGGLRKHPVDLSQWLFGTRMGTHILDLQLPQGDLIELVRKRVPRSAP